MARELRILHWNIHSWHDPSGANNLEPVIDLIHDTDPDIVSLVEVDEKWGMPAILDEVAQRSGYSWIFSPAFEFGGDNSAGGFGNALLTRLPILASQHWHLVRPSKPYDGTEESEPRSVTLAKLAPDAESCWIGSTHLPRNNSDTRTAAMRRLSTLTGQLGRRWLICGDFNAPPSSWPADDRIPMHYPDLVQPTYPAEKPVESIDYCIASPGTLTDTMTLAVQGSDHLPLWVIARLTA